MMSSRKVALLLNHELQTEQSFELENTFGVCDFLITPAEIQRAWIAVPPEGVIPKAMLQTIVEWLAAETSEGDLVFVQGEFGITFYMVDWCLLHNRIPVYATTQRISTQECDGSKKVRFKHVQFRKYCRVQE